MVPLLPHGYVYGRTQVLIAHRGSVLCILLIVKLAPQADTGSNRM